MAVPTRPAADERSVQPRARTTADVRSGPACSAVHTRPIRQQLTTMASDWNDIGAVVDYVRALRRVERCSLLAWSLGGPRAGGYAAQHPEKVRKLVLLAPAYNRSASSEPPAQVPANGRP